MSDTPPLCPECGEDARNRCNLEQIIVDDAGRWWHLSCVKRMLAGIQTPREKRAHPDPEARAILTLIAGSGFPTGPTEGPEEYPGWRLP